MVLSLCGANQNGYAKDIPIWRELFSKAVIYKYSSIDKIEPAWEKCLFGVDIA
jgi:hypothetical protein